MRGWRPALLLAWRDVRRHKGRSALVLVMIALPVLLVTAASVMVATTSLTPAEGVGRELGAADALLLSDGGSGPVVQGADPLSSSMGSDDEDTGASFDPAQVSEILGREARALPLQKGYADVRLGDRVLATATTQVDLADPLTEGLFTLREGRLPEATDEVVINGALADEGVAIGDRLDVESAATQPTVVGIGDDATYRTSPTAAGPVGSLGDPPAYETQQTWLLEAGPVSWVDVLALNRAGALALSRAVLADPPSEDQLPAEMRGMDYTGDNSEMITVVVLIVTMALLEVVLLAGPAFAVGARRQARTLALMAASGGTPRQTRRVVLAGGLVLGGLASGIGVLAGLGIGVASLPIVQRFNGEWLGPVDVPWPVVAGIAGFGLLSALLAAVVPAYLASRQDVAAVLAGRRGDRKPSLRSPLLGLVLVGAGCALAAYGSAQDAGGETPIALAAVVAVLGMILLVPVVVTAVARLARRLPLSLRFAARDAARHRTRTVPAVAAVAATVAGAVTLGIAASSDAAENRETYTADLAMGQGIVTVSGEWSSATGLMTPPSAEAWKDVEAIVRRFVPDAEVVRGVQTEDAESSAYPQISDPAHREEPLLWNGAGRLASPVVVAETAPAGLISDPKQAAAADEALAAGKVVVFADHGFDGDEVRVVLRAWGTDGEPVGKRVRLTWPAYVVPVPDDERASAEAIAPPERAAELGRDIVPIGVLLPVDALTPVQEKELGELLAGADPNAFVYVERGFQDDDSARIILAVLGGLAAILMLGGTLTATFLALSDARPDLATLAAVGAPPRRRRAIAAAYAAVVGLVGALLGAAVGFVPGLAIVRPLTYTTYNDGPSGPFYDVPWLLIVALVVVLPILTAAIVGLTARSRLPLATRVE